MHKLMIVEDEVLIAMHLEETLARMGYEISGRASSGEEAVRMTRELHPDLILMDIGMPGRLDGIDASKKIKAELDIPVVFLTAHADDKLIERASEVEPAGYVLKPFKDSEIKACVEISLYKKDMERRLRESEERYRLVVENANEIIVIVQDGTLKFVNSKAVQFTGREQQELTSRPFVDFVHPDDREKVLERHHEALKGKEIPQLFTFRVVNKDRNIRWVEASSVLINWQGGPATLSFISDVTDRVLTQEALKEYSERLEEMVEERTRALREAQEQLVRREKLAVLGQLAGGVAHELRNPLGAIKNATYFLNMALEQAEPEIKETLEILQKELAASERVISCLLDFARSKPPTRREIYVNDVLQEVLSAVEMPANVKVVSQLGEALPAVLADPDQLRQVFTNIILNAIQAMSEGGRLAIKLEVPSSEWVTVSFSDTGMGIPEEDLRKAFEPLFTTKARGIGLGLALVKTLVEAHGGAIEVQSEQGKGSIFMVKLPRSGGSSSCSGQ
jgi:PAS domain S-box-containing protein